MAAMRAGGAPKDYTISATPLLTLIEHLAQRKQATRVHIARDGFSLRLQRRAAPSNPG